MLLDDKDTWQRVSEHPLGPYNVFKQANRVILAAGVTAFSYAIYKGHHVLWPGVIVAVAMWLFLEFHLIPKCERETQ